MNQTPLFEIGSDYGGPSLWNAGENADQPIFSFQINANIEALLARVGVDANSDNIKKAGYILDKVERDVFKQIADGDYSYHSHGSEDPFKNGFNIPTQYALTMAWMFEEAGIPVTRGHAGHKFSVPPKGDTPLKGMDGKSPPSCLGVIFEILEAKALQSLKSLKHIKRFNDDDLRPR